ncbi:hypothetical protein NC651_012613 [Populus alba x Populus x berolinensis]|nr:hypothetical protein NC651_012613 [Populus alba x Populus x berolinensis]
MAFKPKDNNSLINKNRQVTVANILLFLKSISIVVLEVEDKAIIYCLFFPIAKSDPTWTKHRVTHKASGINKKPFTTRDLLTWTGSMGDQRDPWPRSVTSIALRMGAGLRSPQVGDPTSKFVAEGAAQVAAPVQI